MLITEKSEFQKKKPVKDFNKPQKKESTSVKIVKVSSSQIKESQKLFTLCGHVQWPLNMPELSKWGFFADLLMFEVIIKLRVSSLMLYNLKVV